MQFFWFIYNFLVDIQFILCSSISAFPFGYDIIYLPLRQESGSEHEIWFQWNFCLCESIRVCTIFPPPFSSGLGTGNGEVKNSGCQTQLGSCKTMNDIHLSTEVESSHEVCSFMKIIHFHFILHIFRWKTRLLNTLKCLQHTQLNQMSCK